MDIKLGFDILQDRVKLALSGGSEMYFFWLTRRQCLSIIKACKYDNSETNQPKNTTTQGKAAVQVEWGEELDFKLPELTLRHVTKGLRISLKVKDGSPIILLLKSGDQAGLSRSLRQVANRVHWDLDAAEARMASNQAIQQASRQLH